MVTDRATAYRRALAAYQALVHDLDVRAVDKCRLEQKLNLREHASPDLSIVLSAIRVEPTRIPRERPPA